MEKQLLLLVSTLMLTSLSHSATLFDYRSEEGDYIGKGLSKIYNETDANFSLNFFQNGIMMSANKFDHTDNETIDWSIIAEPLDGQELAVGTYKDAIRFSTETNPGINATGNGRACNQTKGEFKVLDIQYDSASNVTSLAVDFVQHCEGFKPALYGAYRYNSAVPDDLDDYIKSLQPSLSR